MYINVYHNFLFMGFIITIMGIFLFLSGLIVILILYDRQCNRQKISVREQKTDMSISPPTFLSFSLFVKDFEDLIIPDYKLTLTDLTRCELFYLA